MAPTVALILSLNAWQETPYVTQTVSCTVQQHFMSKINILINNNNILINNNQILLWRQVMK